LEKKMETRLGKKLAAVAVTKQANAGTQSRKGSENI
jgi:hypothetical protein